MPPAEAINPAAHRQQQRVFYSALALIASLVVVAVKVWAFLVTGSAALKSDSLENAVNILASLFALVSVVVASRPADRGHPYGHGKIEFFSAAFEGGLVTLASVLILYEGIATLLRGPHPFSCGPGAGSTPMPCVPTAAT